MAVTDQGGVVEEADPGDAARIRALGEGESVTGLLKGLGIAYPRPVVVVIGWAAGEIAPDVMDELDLLMVNALAPLCRDAGAIIVTGGTNVGVMAAVGRAAERAGGCTLVGVAPAKVLVGAQGDPSDQNAATPEPHHIVIATPGETWGHERPYLVRIAEELAEGHDIVVVAIGGNNGTYGELEMAARRGWPIVLVETSRDREGEGASDVVARALLQVDASGERRRFEKGSRRVLASNRPSTWNALVEAERRDLLRRIHLTEQLCLTRLLLWSFSKEELLKDAWRRYARADAAAARNKRPTRALALWVAGLALATAVLAGLRTTIQEALTQWHWTPDAVTTVGVGIKLLITALPLIAVVLLGLMERIARTRPWIEQRSAAEAILGEIYRFRALAAPYNQPVDGVVQESTAAKVLGRSLKAIELQSEGRAFQNPSGVVAGPAWPPSGAFARVTKVDGLLGAVSGSVYDQARVLDQITFHENNSAQVDRRAMLTAMAIFGLSALTTLSFTVSWAQEWPYMGFASILAATTATFVAWRAYKQRDGIVNTSLSTIVLLRHARTKWLSIPSNERDDAARVAKYVTEVEDTFASERLEWQRAVRSAQTAYLDAAKRSGS